jgi:hypothetical protein
VRGARLSKSRPINDTLRDAIDATETPIIPASSHVEGRLALVYHPYVLEEPLSRSLNVSAQVVGIVCHHPPRDRSGVAQYDLEKIVRHTRDLIGVDPMLMPVSDVVRKSLLQIGRTDISEQNWCNLLNLDHWPVIEPRKINDLARIGRHSRPDLLKWPDTVAARLCYPPNQELEFHMLGVQGEVQRAFDPWPSNWIAEPFSPGRAREFLSRLDIYSYFHDGAWIEAFGYNILEAMASGLPIVLPHHFQDTFGDAALYTDPEGAEELYLKLMGDLPMRQAYGTKARKFAEAHHGLETYAARVERLIGKPNTDPAPPLRVKRPERLLVITSNGVGVGHLSRQIAIAKAQPLGVQSSFFSLSKGVRFAQAAGFVAEHRAFHRQIGADPTRWNNWFYHELTEALAFYRPDGVVFDGNMPYQGMLDAMADMGGLAKIWVRRGMWRNPNKIAEKRGHAFDAIIEPDEIASPEGRGFEPAGNAVIQRVPIIVSLAPEDCFSRGVARRLLELPQDCEVALMQLGAGSNFDLTMARDIALEKLFSDPKRHVVELVSPAGASPEAALNQRHHLISEYPAFKFHRAFDFSISGCGYNSFNEMIVGKVPTVFVPNTASEMDLQERRAAYAAHCGWSLTARADDPYGLSHAISQIAGSPDKQASLRRKLDSAHVDISGATKASEIIQRTIRTISRVER